MTKDPRNPYYVRIAYRNKIEHLNIKQVVVVNLIQGVQILQDNLYPIQVDSVNCTIVLDKVGNI